MEPRSDLTAPLFGGRPIESLSHTEALAALRQTLLALDELESIFGDLEELFLKEREVTISRVQRVLQRS